MQWTLQPPPSTTAPSTAEQYNHQTVGQYNRAGQQYTRAINHVLRAVRQYNKSDPSVLLNEMRGASMVHMSV